VATQWRTYPEVLRLPGVVPLAASGLAGRLGFGMLTLPALLLFAERFGSFAVAGAAVAGYGLAGLLAPLRGRLVDRYGAPALVGLAVGHTAAILPVLVVPSTSPWVGVALATLAGAFAPPVAAVTRRGWSARLVGAPTALTQAAFSADSVVEELCFVAGPALSGLLIAVAGAAVALVVAGVLVLVGAVGLALVAAPRRTGALASGDQGEPHVHPRLEGRARTTVLRAALSVTTLGVAVGLVDVGVPALAVDAGHVAWSGPLLALFTVGSLGGVVVAGARAATDLDRRRLQLGVAQVVLLVPLAFARGPVLLAGALVLAGLPLAAMLTTCYLLVDRDVPLATATQAYAWVTVASNVVGSLATAAAGLMVDRVGPGLPLLVAPLAAAVPAALSLLAGPRRRVASGA
jgi:predicted MFS family arabinose efflux permease